MAVTDNTNILWTADIDTTQFDGRLSALGRKVADLQGDERKAYLATLGTIQKLKVETELLRKLREKANNPQQIQQYTARITQLTAQMRQLTNATIPKQGNTLFDSIKQGLGIGAGFSLVAGVMRGSAAIVELGKSSLQAASNAETTRIAFETMLGSKERATELQSQIVDLAAKTPFELTELNDYTKRLMSMGIEHKDVIADMKSLGDVAAGVGKEKLPQIVLAFGQVKAAGKLMGGELKQFTEAGVPLLETLAKQAGKSTAQIRDAISAGTVNFDMVREAMRSLTGEGGKFFNLMEKQSKTLDGMMSNLSDSFNQVQVELGDKLMPTAKAFAGVALDVVSTLHDWVAVPLSEKIKEEQSDVNALVGTIVSINDNYALRNQLITELVQNYPDFLGGLNAEIVTNDELIQRLEQVNKLYKARSEAQFANEQLTATNAKLQEVQKKQFQERMKLFEDLKLSEKDFANLSKQTDEQQIAFLQSVIEKQNPDVLIGQGFVQATKNRLYGRVAQSYGTNFDLEIANAKKRQQAEMGYAATTKQNELEALIAVDKGGLDLAKRQLENEKKELAQLEIKLKSAVGDQRRIIQDNLDAQKELIAQSEKNIEKQSKKVSESRAKQIESQIGVLRGEIMQMQMENKDANGELLRLNETSILRKQDEIAALRLELAKAKKDFEPVKQADYDKKAESKAAKAAKDRKAAQQKEFEDEQNRLKQLAEKRAKLNEDGKLELIKYNEDIAKLNEASKWQSIELIKNRIDSEIATERAEMQKKRDAIIEELAKTEVVRKKGETDAKYQARLSASKTKFTAEVDNVYSPVFAAIQKKGELEKSKSVQEFRDKALQLQKENNDKVRELTLQGETEKLNLLEESQKKENLLIQNEYENRVQQTKDNYNKLREAAKDAYESGLLSIAETDKDAKVQAKANYESYLNELISLEMAANQRAEKSRIESVLKVNQSYLEKAKESAKRAMANFENEFTSISQSAEIQAANESYLKGELNYDNYQKKLTEIQDKYEFLRKAHTIQNLQAEKQAYQDRINATDNQAQGLPFDANNVLNTADYQKAKEEVLRINAEIEAAQSEQSQRLIQNTEQDKKVLKDKFGEWVNAYESVTNAALSALKQIEDAEVAYWDRSIQAQQTRIEKAKVLRDRGNASYLEEEEKRLTQMEEKRRKALARQQFLDRLAQMSSVAVGVARAFADAPAGPAGAAIKIAASLAALAAAYSTINTLIPAPQRFEKGTKFVQGEGGIDKIPAMLTQGERVVDAETNRLYKGSLDLIHDKKLSPTRAHQRLLGLPHMDYSKVTSAVENHSHAKMFSVAKMENLLQQNVELQQNLQKMLSKTTQITNVNVGGKRLHTEVIELIQREQKRKT